jgi:phosphatidylserine/phosphatidylglycerophosphate/cardiolipin synthase-like enzyme
MGGQRFVRPLKDKQICMKQGIRELVDGVNKVDSLTPFFHKGEWALHEVLPILLQTTGQAEVAIATFSISEDSLRPLFFLMEQGKITNLRMLLDLTVKKHKMDLLGFAAAITPHIRIASNHAKLLLIGNAHYHITLIGSANLNTNARYENGVMFNTIDMYNFFVQKFDDAYQQSQEWN